jgi:hypothetical protein
MSLLGMNFHYIGERINSVKRASLLLMFAWCANAEPFVVDAEGRLAAIFDKGERLAVSTDVLDAAGKNLRHRVVEEAGRVVVLAAEDGSLPQRFAVVVPRAAFTGGTVEIGQAVTAIGATRTAGSAIATGEAPGATLKGPMWDVRLEFDGPRRVSLGELWTRRGRFYVLEAEAKASKLGSISWTARPDSTPAVLTLDASKSRFKLHGFGGNYCFSTESPVTQYTLANLPSAWSRIEMNSREWEPENDNESPEVTDFSGFKTRDVEGTKLRRDFLLAKQIQAKKIPYIISAWRLPEWLYSDPNQQPASAHRRRVPPEKWSELLEHLGSYLLYMREQYGAEPDLFSFNEANIGVNVIFTPDEHRSAIKSIGAHFEKLGLKTKMLLGDATGPRGTHEWTLAAANDPEALKYVGAVAFHSWEGGTPEHYRAWGDLAEWLNLPLVVAEVGVDAFAWQGRLYDSFDYGMREVEMYQELLLYARPQGFLQWEYTGDYSLARVLKKDDGVVEVKPTARFWFLKQFSELTPMHSEALETASDHKRVLYTAFRGNGVLSMHVANLAGAREVTIRGIPEGISGLRMVRTSATEEFKTVGTVAVRGGVATFEAPERCLVTLVK